jgi:hypothetical protein
MPFLVDSIDPSTTALIVVDMENDFIAGGAPLDTPAGRAMLPTLKRTLAFCRKRGISVIYTTHTFRRDGCDLGRFADDPSGPIARQACLIDGEPGIEIYPEIAPQADEIVVKKHRYSAFYGTDLESSCGAGGWRPSSSPASRPRTVVTPPPVTLCFVTTAWSFSPMRLQPVTSRMWAKAACRRPRSIGPRW